MNWKIFTLIIVAMFVYASQSNAQPIWYCHNPMTGAIIQVERPFCPNGWELISG